MEKRSPELASFIKRNKTSREAYAKKMGFSSAEAYMKYLNGGPQTRTRTNTSSPKNEKKSPKQPLTDTTNSPKNKPIIIHVVDVCDRSGSMSGSRIKAAAKGINMGIAALRTPEEGIRYTHSLIDFESKVKVKHIGYDPLNVGSIGISTFGSTALFDAIGDTITNLEKIRKEGEKVLVNIYTDGQENNSSRYTQQQVAKLIEEYTNRGYTFTFIGTQRDVDYVTQRLNVDISNSLVYDGTGEDLERGMSETRSARTAYVSNVKAGNDVSIGFYKNIKK